MKGKIPALREKLDRYETENQDFIVLHAGLSRYRTMRVFLLSREAGNAIYVYDVIIPKRQKQTAKSLKQETVKKLKADLGALTEEEKDEMKQEMTTQVEFLNNPFFYADVADILADLNFKNYLQTVFNTVLYSDGSTVSSFADVDEHHEQLFIAHVGDPEEHSQVLKAIHNILADKKAPNIFYTRYKHVLESSTVPLQLENFSETAEFFEGLDPAIKQKCKVSPLTTKGKVQPTSYLERVQSPVENKNNMRLAKCLNKNPLRRKTTSQSTSVLPGLPQRYVIDKQNFKVPTLRHVLRGLSDWVAIS
jgi:hypothetical protein